jgi:hypothetical protein
LRAQTPPARPSPRARFAALPWRCPAAARCCLPARAAETRHRPGRRRRRGRRWRSRRWRRETAPGARCRTAPGRGWRPASGPAGSGGQQHRPITGTGCARQHNSTGWHAGRGRGGQGRMARRPRRTPVAVARPLLALPWHRVHLELSQRFELRVQGLGSSSQSTDTQTRRPGALAFFICSTACASAAPLAARFVRSTSSAWRCRFSRVFLLGRMPWNLEERAGRRKEGGGGEQARRRGRQGQRGGAS